MEPVIPVDFLRYPIIAQTGTGKRSVAGKRCDEQDQEDGEVS
jgi:hypothetical protein